MIAFGPRENSSRNDSKMVRDLVQLAGLLLQPASDRADRNALDQARDDSPPPIPERSGPTKSPPPANSSPIAWAAFIQEWAAACRDLERRVKQCAYLPAWAESDDSVLARQLLQRAAWHLQEAEISLASATPFVQRSPAWLDPLAANSPTTSSATCTGSCKEPSTAPISARR